MALKLDKLTILLVEDTPPLAELMAEIIGTLGVKKLHTATNGTDGFDIFCRTNPDIVITDWHMPTSCGMELLKNIRTSSTSPNRLVPIIMITGYSSASKISQCRDGGITEYILKPFTAEDLIMRISHVIKRPRDFIECSNYFGPDRRRNKYAQFNGTMRRADDQLKTGHT